MCGIPLSVHSLVTGLAVSLHGNSRLATCTRLNSRSTLRLKILGHLRLSWPTLFLFAGSWLPCGLPSRRCSSFQRICYSDSAASCWSHSSSGNSKFLSRFVAASSSFCLGSSPGVAGSTSLASSRLACSSGCCHCSTARHLHARMWNHTAQQ